MDWISLVLATLSAAFVAAGFVWSVVVFKRQMNAQLFLEFTRRYEAVSRSIVDASGDVVDLQDVPPETSRALTAGICQLLNLYSEEFYLYRRRYLDRKIWTIWEDEIRSSLSAPLMRREWPALRAKFDSFPEFQSFVDGCVLQHP